jgi:hypothetical protein
MRKVAHSQSDKLHAFAIAGTRAILIALNMRDEGRKGLLGFAFRWSVGDGEFQWLKGMNVFPSLAPQSGGGKKRYKTSQRTKIQFRAFFGRTAVGEIKRLKQVDMSRYDHRMAYKAAAIARNYGQIPEENHACDPDRG